MQKTMRKMLPSAWGAPAALPERKVCGGRARQKKAAQAKTKSIPERKIGRINSSKPTCI